MSVKPQPKVSRQNAPAPSPAPAKPVDEKGLRELTARIAYERYERRGRVDGHALEDWLAAEKIARQELTP